MLLATDLDGTFLGGKSLHKLQLYQMIRENEEISLVFVTGRGLESVIPLLNDPIIPNPDYIICDVGATIVDGHTLEPIEKLQSAIEKKWPGHIQIRETLKEINGLVYQEVPQQRRCSFFVKDDSLTGDVQRLVSTLGCDVIYSAGKFLDVLPGGINKGSSLIKLIDWLCISKDSVLVAGDTLNDLAMYTCGFKGVVVGNAEARLVHATAAIDKVYQAHTAGAGGIMESFTHFSELSAGLSWPAEKDEPQEHHGFPQLLMMYHRFPYELAKINGKTERVSPKSPNGILPTLQGFFAKGRPGVWIAWEEVEQEGEQLRNIYIDKEQYPNLVASRIGLTKNEVNIFYKKFAKEAFWPTIFSFIDKAKFNHNHWEHYVKVNRLFAEKAAREADHGAIVWIHDYNLWLVPGFLRQLRPDLIISFFHHTAFPAANTFNILPWRREIIGSLLQCDYVGFHIPRYVENFVDVVKSLFPVNILDEVKCAPKFLTYSTAIGVDSMTRVLQTDHRKVFLGADPVGINYKHIQSIVAKDKVRRKIKKMKHDLGDRKMILSVERLDYVKGPLEKILAFESFLSEHPEYHGKVELVNICTPPADGMKIYDDIRLELELTVGRINGKYADMQWTPVRVFFKSIPFEELVAYYGMADIAWITPLRDGLNLVAKEYIAVQGEWKDSRGMLVLSEFAGSAVEFPYAILTNPYDQQSLKEGLLHALEMPEADRQMRMSRLYEQVKHYDIDYWAEEFMNKVMSTRDETSTGNSNVHESTNATNKLPDDKLILAEPAFN